MTNTIQASPRTRGFLVMDAVGALAVALALLMLMTMVIFQQRTAEQRLAAVRSATHSAETTLLNLQTGNPAPAGTHIDTLADPAPPGYSWIRLTEPPTAHAKSVSLVGLVPSASLKRAGGGAAQ